MLWKLQSEEKKIAVSGVHKSMPYLKQGHM